MTEEEVVDPAVTPAEEPPRRRLWQNLTDKVPGFSVPLEQFEKDMDDPAARQRLHANLSAGGKLHDKFEGFAVPAEQFDADMQAAAPEPEPKKKAEPAATGAPAGAPSQEFVSVSPAGPDWEALNKLPAGAPAELATVGGAAPVRTVEGTAGIHAERVIGLPRPEKNTERVRLPDDLPAEAEPPGTYRLEASTDPNARYFDRPLSKVAEGEIEEQDEWTAAGRTFVNGLKEMGQGGLEYLGAADRRLRATAAGQALDAAGGWVGLNDDAGRGNPFQQGADAIEASKEKVAAYHAQGELDVADPATWPVAAARTAALAAPLVLSAAFPESKVAGILQKVAAVGFDSQLVHGSFERAKQAGLAPGSKEYDTYALADATATMLVFKGLGHVLEAPAQTALRRALIGETMERVAAGEAFDAAFAAASRSKSQLLRATASGAVTLGAVGAANEVKTKVGERVFNAATGTETFPEQSLGEATADVLRAGGQMALIGGAAGLAGAVGQRQAEAPAFDVVRPTGQTEYENVRVLDEPDAQGEVRIVGTDKQGQPVETRVKADHLKPRHNAPASPTDEQAIDPTGAAGHPEGPRAGAEQEAPAAESGEDGQPAGSRDSPATEAGPDQAAGRAAARPVGTPGVVEGQPEPGRLPDAPEGSRWLRSEDGRTTAAVAPDGVIHFAPEGDAAQGADVLGEAVAQGGTTLTVDNPTDAFYLDQAGWRADEADPYTFTAPAVEPAPVAAPGPAVQRAPVTPPLKPTDVEPHPGPLKPVRQAIADLRAALGGAFRFGRGKQGALYDPAGRVTAFQPNDLKDASHEIGHALDDRYGIAPGASIEVDAELRQLRGQGSAAPVGHPNPTAYDLAESQAEFFRRLLLQPTATRQQFPHLTARYEARVPAEVRAGVDAFGQQVRGHLGTYRPGATNVETGPAEQPGRVEKFRQRVKGGERNGRPAWFNRWDRFLGDWVDPLRPFQKAEDYFRRVLDKPMDAQHPRSIVNQMVRLYDLMGKIEDISTRGMRAFSPRVVEDANGVPSTERIIDGVTGEAKTDEWLFQPFAAGGDHAAAKAKRQYAAELGVAQRTVAAWRDRLAARIEDALDEGQVIDSALLAKHPDIAGRKIEVTDRATATSPRSKRIITFEQANNEALARRQAHTQRVRDTRQKRADGVDTGINKQVDRWKDYGKQAYKAWKQSKSTNEAAAIIDELVGKVEVEEAAAGFSAQGKRVAGKVSTLLKRAAAELNKARAEGREARAEAILDRINTKIDERIKGLEKLRQARHKANGEKYDGRVASLAKREQFSAIDEEPGDVLTGLGMQGSGAADLAKAAEILAHHERLRQSDKQYATDVEEGLRRYRSLAQDVLSYLRDAGRLSTEQYEAITASGADYIALQRVLEPTPGEDIADTFQRTARRGIGGGSKVVHRFKGSGRSIKDPWVSLLAGRTRSIDAADRNAVLRSWRDLATDLRGMYDAAPGEAADGAGNLMRKVEEAKDGNVTIYVDGQAEYWQMDPDFARFMTEFGEVLPGNAITKIMGVFKGLLTKTPKFVVRNLPRDLLDQLINSRSGQVKGIAANLGPNGKAWRGAASEILEAHGGSQAGNYPRSEPDYDKYVDRAIAKINGSKKNFATRTADVGRKYMELVEGSEQLGRRREATAAYQKYKSEGYSNEDAALAAAMQARGLMDFARAGRVARKFNQYFPFLTARIAGLRTMFTSAAHSPGKWALRYARYAVAPVLMEQALIALMGRDDEYEQKSAADKQTFFNIPLPNGGWLMVAKPFEIGAAATMMVAEGKEHLLGVENAAEGQVGHLLKSFAPAEDFVPTGPVGAGVDAARNHDGWRDQTLVPEREKNLRLDDPNRHQERASRLGQGVGAATRIDARKVDYFIRSTTGMVGQLAQAASDIGRDDKQTNWATTSGLYKSDPVAHARDVEWLNQKFTEWGVTGNADMKQLKAKVDAWYAADEQAKPELADQVRELAVALRRKYPEEEIRRLRAAKDGYGAEEED